MDLFGASQGGLARGVEACARKGSIEKDKELPEDRVGGNAEGDLPVLGHAERDRQRRGGKKKGPESGGIRQKTSPAPTLRKKGKSGDNLKAPREIEHGLFRGATFDSVETLGVFLIPPEWHL